MLVFQDVIHNSDSEYLKGFLVGFPVYYHVEDKWDREIVCPMSLGILIIIMLPLVVQHKMDYPLK